MEDYRITKKQILELDKFAVQGCDNVIRDRLKLFFPEAFKKELEVGVWYKSNAGSIVFRTDDSGNYGFCRGMIWKKNLLCYDSNNWKEATPQEVKQALENEVIKRFGKDWRSAKIKKCLVHGDSHSNSSFISLVTTSEIWNINGCIYKNRVFAEPMKSKVISMKKALKIIAKKLKVSPEDIKIR